ncbi:SGNH/GDSL hydrolase family protein [Ethanoligenens sp.]|uniref:SGNH/GDSL hydrolase family protein n=1 Tax=Ethanoligenens sp. TaxID=2099655 RepID=UPI0039ED0668
MYISTSKKCFLALLTVFVFLLAAFPAQADTPKTRSLVYTALGDSIASGYKLSQSSNAYVNLYGSYLSAQTTNLARVGLNSSGLLKLLTSDEAMMKQIKKSDIVTISIGGNDLLPIFSSLQPTSPASLLNAIQKITGAAMQKQFQSAVTTFSQNWDKIVAQVKKLAPHAQIIATTLIDPYQGMIVSLPVVLHFDLGEYADRYIKQIDAVISGHAKSGQYAVADAHSLFAQHKTEKLTNADLSKSDFDPHPNAAGHRLLFQAHQSVPLKFTDSALALEGPTRITIPADQNNTSTRFSAQPLLTCFTAANTTTQIVYSVADRGNTQAVIDAATGTLYVDKPGTVEIKATLTAMNAAWTAETTATIHVSKALVTQETYQKWVLPICVISAILIAVILLLLIRRMNRFKKT